MKRFFSKPYTVTATLKNSDFIHLLPAQLIQRAATEARGGVSMGCEGRKADAKDVLQLIKLKAGPGSVLTISASEGADRRVVDALAALIREGFGEE